MARVKADSDIELTGTNSAGLGKAFFDFIFPPICHLCGAFISEATDIHICSLCRGKCIPVDIPFCRVCGIPFMTEGGDCHVCGACLTSAPPFTAARAALLYEGGVRELIHRFKYGYKVHHCRPLGLMTARQLAPFVREVAPDLLVPVPLHRKRLRQRCFNQALLLGEILGAAWQLPLVSGNLRRVRWTEPQINLSAELRAQNVRGAFAVTEAQALEGKRVVLVDDVYTTGSTVAECAKVIKSAGATMVYAVTVARTLS